MKVTLDFGPTEYDIEDLDGGMLVWVRLPDLSAVDDETLLRVHRHAVAEMRRLGGPLPMGIAARVLKPLEREMERRGIRPPA